MYVARVPLQKAQEIKEYIIQKDLSDERFRMQRDGDFLLIPVQDEFSHPDVEFVDMDPSGFDSIPQDASPKDMLKGKLSDTEFEHLKTSFDTVGNIAIIEIDEELKPKEQVIADAILAANPQIKTVVKKVGRHHGEFRTQKVEVIAGKDTKEAEHRENGVALRLNVEEVYFSPRLSTERKRIAGLVEPDEDILVMFSGCAPYPCVLAKNTQAKSIVGVEINPAGHRYGVRNIEKNKIVNVTLYNGDVRKVLPVRKVGLKTWWDPSELDVRLREDPGIVEFFLKDGDLENNLVDIEKAIARLHDKHVYIHQPFRFAGDLLPLDLDHAPSVECFRLLERLCRKHWNVRGFICHCHGYIEETKEYIAFDADKAADFARQLELRHAYFENTTGDVSGDLDVVAEIAKAAGAGICIDLVHLYIRYQDNAKMLDVVKRIVSQHDCYFHVADSSGIHDSLPLGEGKIDFPALMPFIEKGILEIVNKDEKKGTESIRSFRDPVIAKKFDRILMPLPKSAEDFLDIALAQAKDGAVVHFYDFLAEDEFHLAHEKIDAACKKSGLGYDILQTVKCGQHAPRVYRICVDFRVSVH